MRGQTRSGGWGLCSQRRQLMAGLESGGCCRGRSVPSRGTYSQEENAGLSNSCNSHPKKILAPWKGTHSPRSCMTKHKILGLFVGYQSLQ